MRETKEALEWIVNILRKNKIPFEITGGFASRIYGSKRILADIDIEVPDKSIPYIQKLTKRYIIYGPREYKDNNFDLPLMTLKYKGQKIDICGKDSEKIYNKENKIWINEKTNLSKAKTKKVYDLLLPVVPLKDLVTYKKELGRNVDKRDIIELSTPHNPSSRIFGIFFFIFGIFFLLNSNLNFTGAFIGSQNVFSSLNLIFGVAFILVSFIIFAFIGRLENNLTETEERELKGSAPVIIDTNYLIEACKNPQQYKSLMGFIKTRHNKGHSVIVPKSVYEEFKFMSGDEGEVNRIKNLKETLTACTTTLEDMRGDIWTNPDIKRKSMRQAEEILRQTPKYLAYKYLSEINNGEHTTVERFISKSRGKMSNAFPEYKYEDNLQNAAREFNKIRDKTGAKGKNNLLRGYDVSPADIDVLSGAIYMKEMLGGRKDKPLYDIEIISKDSHLIDSSSIFNRLSSGKNKINVKEQI